MSLQQILGWDIVLPVSNMSLSTQAGYWLPTVRCLLADRPPWFSTLPSGWQFTACNLVEKMWSLLVFCTDRLCFVLICRASWMLGAKEKRKKNKNKETTEDRWQYEDRRRGGWSIKNQSAILMEKDTAEWVEIAKNSLFIATECLGTFWSTTNSQRNVLDTRSAVCWFLPV